VSLTFIIFRILAWSSLVSLGVFAFLNADKFASLDSEITDAQNGFNEKKIKLEIDKNESSNLINGLYRERGVLRQKNELTQENILKMQEDFEILKPKKEDLERKISKKEKELAELTKKLKQVQENLVTVRDEVIPFQERSQSLKSELTALKTELSEKKAQASSKQGDLDALTATRRVVSNAYVNRRDALLEELKKPAHTYYGDELEVVVTSGAPSGKGFFLSEGYLAGLREGMIFLTRKADEGNSDYFFTKATLVQDRLSFIEFGGYFSGNLNPQVHSDEKLFLIRTGDSNTNF
jgi:predicted  nucleic acid-binding Zn-ribbon protein